ncbi:MAG: hypothetical protein IK084_01825 [Bacteroidaceae bacterium]|nr:hypothetical protein [Bacteroidaceae bacterium]
MLKLTIIVLVIVAIAVALLTVNIWLRGGEFRSQHIGQSKEMRKRGIHCVQSMDAMERRKSKQKKVKERN